jgi:hypothetical protein
VGDGKTVKIKCATWDQVEAFYTEKLRGNMLVVKMPFRPGIGDGMTVALGLPDGLVFAIDGTVVKIGGEDGGKIPVAIKLFGMTLEVRAQLKRLVANGRGAAGTPPSALPARPAGTRPPRSRTPETVPPAPQPRAEDVADEERAAYATLETLRRRLLALPAHAVLDVPPDADAEAVRAGFLARAQKLHPDLYRRYGSPAVRALAAEAYLHVRRAYERMLGAPAEPVLLVAEPAADAAPSEASAPVEPMRSAGSAPYSELSIVEGGAATPPGYDEEVTFTTSVRSKALTAEELFADAAEAEPATIPPVTPAPATLPPVAPPPPEVDEATPTPTPVPVLTPTPTPLPVSTPTATAAPGAPPAPPPPPSVDDGRSALAEGRFREACEAFAAILRAEPRNRQVRALYHVASGMELRQKGDGVKARLMFETALAHDRECEEAQRALNHEPDKKGIFKRLFDR